MRIGEEYEAARQRFLQQHGPFYYIAVMGTAPEQQGRGLGSRLLRHITARADAEGRPAYIEATAERSRRLYLRHGFEELATFRPRCDMPPTYLMARPAATTAAVEATQAETRKASGAAIPAAATLQQQQGIDAKLATVELLQTMQAT